MGRWVPAGYVTETPKQVFKTALMWCGALNIFAFMGLLYIRIHNSEHTKSKWIGGLIGTAMNTAALVLTGIFGAGLGITPLAVVIFFGYYVFLILFGIFYKPKEKAVPIDYWRNIEEVCLPEDYDTGEKKYNFDKAISEINKRNNINNN